MMIDPTSKTRALRLRYEFLYPVIVTIALSLFAPAFAKATSSELQLNEKLIVAGNVVTLADLFKNAGVKGNTAVFRSPDPGTTGKVSVNRIVAAASKHGLKLVNEPVFQMVTITRSSRIIEISELEDLVRGRLEDKLPQIDGKGQLVIKLPKNLQKIHLDSKVRGELELSSFDWSNSSGRFTAHFTIARAMTDPIIIRGTASMMIEVGVASKNIARGKMLSSGDVEMKFVKYDRRNAKRLANIEEMTGLVARRRLRAGRPVSLKDLEQPRLVRKNQLVTILLEVPGLVLRTEGKALADATKGETVKVLNTQSKRIIHATAIASGLVRVSLNKTSKSGS